MSLEYPAFKKIFQTMLCVDDEYMPTASVRMASGNNKNSVDYSDLESMPFLKNRVLAAMKQIKLEAFIPESKKFTYFDEHVWVNSVVNQVHQINRLYDSDPFLHVLVREADDLLTSFYGLINPGR